ncbi:MAG: hypothetical protein LBF39_00075 [Prevotellaceae bacterium]|nr:hypothetical protein [Prevotellaceae bacterium]
MSELSKIKRNNDILYSDITGDIATKLLEVINGKLENREKARILNEIISLSGFATISKGANGKLQTVTKKFETIKDTDPEYNDNLNAAKSLNNIGYDVYMIPKLSGSKSPDFILVKGSKAYLYELKTIYGVSSLENRLEAGFLQADRLVLNMVGNIDSRYVADTIKDFYLRHKYIKEIKVLLGGKPIDVYYDDIVKKNFTKKFMNK